MDAQRAAAGRGILDTRQNTELGLARAGQDYGFGVEDLRRDAGRGREDLTTGYQRGTFDLDRSYGRGKEDYSLNTQALQRSFNILAGQQAQAQRVAGVSHGGAVLQAAAKRRANQALQQQGLDLGFRRMGEDYTTTRGRMGEDYNRGTARIGEDEASGLGRLGVGYNRQVTDAQTGLARAERENTMFGLDVNAQRYFQAAQSGWEPPRRRRPR